MSFKIFYPQNKTDENRDAFLAQLFKLIWKLTFDFLVILSYHPWQITCVSFHLKKKFLFFFSGLLLVILVVNTEFDCFQFVC